MKKLLFILLCVIVGCAASSKQSSPFKGEWKQETDEELNLLKIDLYEKTVKLPDESGTCFGYLQTENEFAADYWIIDEVTNITNDSANVKIYSWRYGNPEEKNDRVLLYNSNEHTITVKQEGYSFTLSPTENSNNNQ